MTRIALGLLLCVTLGSIATFGQAMPDPKQISGVPLLTSDLPAGTVSVRVIRGSFDKNLANVPVDFLVEGKTKTLKTGADGRAEISGLDVGSHVKASVVVDGERVESQEFGIGATGIRLVLSVTDPEAAAREAADRSLAAGPAVAGTVVLGSNSRIVADFSQDRLSLYYIVEVLNTARTPVDIGGPLVLNLPPGAAGASVLQESSKQAVVKGERVVVTGPFAPGTTNVEVAFELPYTGGTAHVEQKWPAALQELTLIALKTGAIDLQSAQVTSKRVVTDQGQPVIAGDVPAIASGQALVFDITGLPHHPEWPRYTALAMAAFIVTLGIWAAVTAPKSRRLAA